MAERATLFAPAKINLYLHVAQKRDDGYHDLDSLAVFADIGDKIHIEPARDFQLVINGPYASAFTAQEKELSPRSGNLVARAALALAQRTDHHPDFRITLTKNIPLASGLGGGSADAAAVLWGLMDLWKIPLSTAFLPNLMRDLGADVPACLRCAPVRMSGVGDILEHIPDLPEIPVVLVNPGKRCPTPDVFRRFIGPMRGAKTYPDHFSDPDIFLDFIAAQENDLTPAALEIAPEIEAVSKALHDQPGCRLARMSGSGATVFGLFPNYGDAVHAAEKIALDQPRWWVRTGTINSPERY